ncbi:MAG: nucleoside deaminase [Alphaproteobacteria bacterium]|nr:nucleoside deaminase [Alphaproteobacteria bacterium]MBN2675245.1 nucleoside deaminase [Alphaproteobacteria bacterium]
MDFMKQAFICAEMAKSHDDVPIGAVIVHDGKIIAHGENQVQFKKNPILHAEIVAINKACKKLNSKFLDDCEIYITLEPCAMCAVAISYARIKKIYFAARDIKGGAILHNSKIFQTDKHLWKPEVVEVPEFGIQSADLLQDFFKAKRK